MASPPVHHIDVRAFRYATEVPERVETAIDAVYPLEAGDDEGAPLTVVPSEGHFGDRIDVYELSVESTRDCERVFERLRERGDLQAIDTDLPDRVTDDCDLFLRFDKQRAYQSGELTLGQGIEVRMRLEAYPARPAAAIENLRAYLDEIGADA